MKKLARTINVAWIVAILLMTVSVRGMESNNSSVTRWAYDRLSLVVNSLLDPLVDLGVNVLLVACPLSPEEQAQQSKKYTQEALQATQYNDNDCQLTSLPNEMLLEIFPHCITQGESQKQSLKNSIKTFMQLRAICKNFNVLLTFVKIGDLCKNYAQNDKNFILDDLRCGAYLKQDLDDNTSKTRCFPALILICAGADVNIVRIWLRSIFRHAISNNDVQLATTLFQLNVHLNLTKILFEVKTVEMAQICIAHGANIHATTLETIALMYAYRGSSSETNILWHIVRENYSSELMEFYLKKKVDATQNGWENRYCLLHGLAEHGWAEIENVDDFLKKGDLLLEYIPHMINMLGLNKKTPLDIALRSLQEATTTKTKLALEQLIELYKKHGGLTAQELATQKLAAQKTTSLK